MDSTMMLADIVNKYAADWNVFMAAASEWLHGGNPYGLLPLDSNHPGQFAYPPTALPWLSMFLPFGALGFYVWTVAQLVGWWLIIRRRNPLQISLLCWSPLIYCFLVGQSTLAMVLVLWAATLAKRRGFWWGMALALTLTKPQVSLLPIAWMLWNDRRMQHRILHWSGIVTGTLALALPSTLLEPRIWSMWLHALVDYRAAVYQMAPWQGFGAPVLLVAGALWYHLNRGSQVDAGWQWWLSAAIFPQTALYSSVVLMPLLRPQQTYWTIAGLALASLLIPPVNEITLPIILSGHVLCAWLISGGPRKVSHLRQSRR
jgi:hypothetical protein